MASCTFGQAIMQVHQDAHFRLHFWLDIDFGIAEGVDFIAISFVKSAEVIKHLKSYIAARSRGRYQECNCGHVWLGCEKVLMREKRCFDH